MKQVFISLLFLIFLNCTTSKMTTANLVEGNATEINNSKLNLKDQILLEEFYKKTGIKPSYFIKELENYNNQKMNAL